MTIKDIAALSGVTPSTVSKILNKKDGSISEETRRRVLDVINEHQFVPYSKAIKDHLKKMNVLGVLLRKNGHEAANLLYEIERQALSHGYAIMLCYVEEANEELKKYIETLESKGVEGIIALYQDFEKAQDIANDFSIPIVFVEQQVPESRDICCVYHDPIDIGYTAAKHLLMQGHVQVACILSKDDIGVEEGYIKAHYEQGVAVLSPNIITLNGEESDLDKAICRCLDNNSTAIICSNAKIAACVYVKVSARGEVIPNDLSVLSLRDEDMATMLRPTLTALHVPIAEVAALAVSSLIKNLEDEVTSPYSHEKIMPKILERQSVHMPTSSKQGGKIVVVGSMNMDCIIFLDNIPNSGETVLSNATALIPGGKGANQAVGAGKLGGHVYMIGCLGNDNEGKEIYNSMISSGVKVDAVTFEDSVFTGKAFIQVPHNGESTIVVYTGANEKLNINHIKAHEHLLDGARFCLIPTEIGKETVEYTIEQCARRNVEVIVKPAIVKDLSDEALKNISYLIPNVKELEQMVSGEISLEEKVDVLISKNVANVIVTLGSKGCYYKSRLESAYFPEANFQAIDTTGGADAFISALAVFLSEGYNIAHAIGYATYSAGICISQPGVQPAMVDRKGLEMYKDEIISTYRL